MNTTIFREATIQDIPQMAVVRNAVKENALSDPSLITPEDYIEFITVRGKGWVCEVNKQIVGFSIPDLVDNNIWALFLHPDFENQGIGRKLHDTMLDWYFAQGKTDVWLGTAPATRAEQFYRQSGWKQNGMYGKEVRFEMTKTDWERIKQSK
ncbi:GNAT family N-acetyltransferase [Flavobacterium sp. PLA-1-15]|uniref:GNAT family N-acetyltransferase n=1 Tax=Flavobacterium sp. PLA-1-15 TaxID=3380533 RepID=UPI003B76A93C